MFPFANDRVVSGRRTSSAAGRRRAPRLIAWAAVAVSIVPAATDHSRSVAQDAPPANARLEQIQAGYRKNCDAFRQLVAKGAMVTGRAKDYDDGFKENYGGPPTVSGEGYYACDDGVERFDLLYDEEVTASGESHDKATGLTSSMYEPRQLQVREDTRFEFHPRRKSASIRKQGRDVLLSKLCPVDLGFRSMPKGDFTVGAMIDRVAQNDESIRFSDRGETTVGDAECWEIAFEIPADQISYVYSVAPGRGFLPMSTKIVRGEELIHETRVLETQQFADSGWLPTHAVGCSMIGGGRGGETPVMVRSLRFEEIRVGPPSPEEIGIALPSGIGVFDTIESVHWKAGEGGAPSLFDLRTYNREAQAATPVPHKPVPAAVVNQQADRSRTLYWLIVGNVAVAVVVVGAFVIMRRRRAG